MADKDRTGRATGLDQRIVPRRFETAGLVTVRTESVPLSSEGSCQGQVEKKAEGDVRLLIRRHL